MILAPAGPTAPGLGVVVDPILDVPPAARIGIDLALEAAAAPAPTTGPRARAATVAVPAVPGIPLGPPRRPAAVPRAAPRARDDLRLVQEPGALPTAAAAAAASGVGEVVLVLGAGDLAGALAGGPALLAVVLEALLEGVGAERAHDRAHRRADHLVAPVLRVVAAAVAVVAARGVAGLLGREPADQRPQHPDPEPRLRVRERVAQEPARPVHRRPRRPLLRLHPRRPVVLAVPPPPPVAVAPLPLPRDVPRRLQVAVVEGRGQGPRPRQLRKRRRLGHPQAQRVAVRGELLVRLGVVVRRPRRLRGAGRGVVGRASQGG